MTILYYVSSFIYQKIRSNRKVNFYISTALLGEGKKELVWANIEAILSVSDYPAELVWLFMFLVELLLPTYIGGICDKP